MNELSLLFATIFALATALLVYALLDDNNIAWRH